MFTNLYTLKFNLVIFYKRAGNLGNSFSVDILQNSEIKNNQVALWQGLLYIEFVEEII